MSATKGFEQNFSVIYKFDSLTISHSTRSKSMIFNAKVKSPPLLSDAEVIQTMEITVEQARHIVSELQKRIDYIDASGDTGHSISGAFDVSMRINSTRYFFHSAISTISSGSA